MKKIIFFAMLIFSLMSSLYAYSIYDLFVGSEIPHHDGRMAAMGGTGVAGGFSLFDSSINPANLYFLSGNHTQLTYCLIKNSENRAIPLWNFFDSYSDESTYARNEHFYNELAIGLHYGMPIAQGRLSFAFIYRPLVNFGAGYVEEVRNDENQDHDNYPPIIAKNFIESSGLLNSFDFLLSYGLPLPSDYSSISIGAQVSILSGTHEHEKRIHWSDIAHDRVGLGVLHDFYEASSSTMTGIATRFGISSQINNRLRLGVAYQPKATLDREWDGDAPTQGTDSVAGPLSALWEETPTQYIVPSRLRLGLLFQPRNPFRTNFQVDVEFINYTEMDRFYEDGYAIRVGMEHYIGRAAPLRLGFSHQTARQNRSISLPTISAGTGFTVINNVTIDLAGEYGKREYLDLDLFPDSFYNYGPLWRNVRPADRGWENPDNVTESFLKIFASISYKF
jgi:hypothetical protein